MTEAGKTQSMQKYEKIQNKFIGFLNVILAAKIP